MPSSEAINWPTPAEGERALRALAQAYLIVNEHKATIAAFAQDEKLFEDLARFNPTRFPTGTLAQRTALPVFFNGLVFIELMEAARRRNEQAIAKFEAGASAA